MSLSHMQVFDKYIMPATIISLDQQIDKFNAASAGTIVLSSEGMTGDFMRESFFASLAGAQRRVNRYTTTSAQAATDLTELTGSKVKVAGGFGPVRSGHGNRPSRCYSNHHANSQRWRHCRVDGCRSKRRRFQLHVYNASTGRNTVHRRVR